MKKTLVFILMLAMVLSLIAIPASAEGEAFLYSFETTVDGERVYDLSSLAVGTEITVTVTMTRTDIEDGDTYEAWGFEMDITDFGLDYIAGTGWDCTYQGETFEVTPSNYWVGGATGTGAIRFYFITGSSSETFTLAKTVSVSARYIMTDSATAQVAVPMPLLYLEGSMQKADIAAEQPYVPIDPHAGKLTVTFDPAGGVMSTPSTLKVTKGESIVLPGATRKGFALKGWDDGTAILAEGSEFSPTEDVTLTAVWKSEGGPVDVTVNVLDTSNGITAEGTINGDGSVTVHAEDPEGTETGYVLGGLQVIVTGVDDGQVVAIIDPETGAVLDIVEKSYVENGTAWALLDGPATIKIIDNVKPFEDVNSGAWYNAAVEFVSSHELFNGVSATVFSPESRMTRGMLVTVLWRLEGKPDPGNAEGFDDVAEGLFYSDAVRWAAENGIVNGVGGGKFLPDDNISREQMAAVLHRYVQYIVRGINAGDEDLSVYSDVTSVSEWAFEDVSWAVGAGIFRGRGDGTLGPQATASRAEVAQMLLRLVASIVK